MKAITYIVALLLPAIASGLLESTLRLDDVVPDETEVESRGFERKLGNRVLGSKSTKGGKGGKGSKGSKGSNCESHRVYYEIDDYKEKVSIIGTGDAELGFAVDRVKVFDAKSTKAVGFVTETSIAAGEFDCTVSGAFSFGAKAGRSSNQVFYQGTCSTQRENVVTGGSGNFICSSGVARVVKKTPSKIFVDLLVCGSC